MKKYFIIVYGLVALTCSAQKQEDLFVPIEISYFPYNNYKIDWEDEKSKDIWINILTYPVTNPRDSRELYVKDKEAYKKKANKLLFTRQECDSLIKDYVKRITTKIPGRIRYGEGAYYDQEKSGDRTYIRCVALPASEIKELSHGDATVVGMSIKYLEPKDFTFRFKRYGLDSLDLAEAPYYTIFPMDITPSFDCSKARTPIEKAICRNSILANIDTELLELYKVALSKGGEEIRIHQIEWKKERDKLCEGKNNDEITQLLIELYRRRISELKISK